MIKVAASLATVLLLTTVTAAMADQKSMNTQIDQTNFLVNSGCSGTLIDATHVLTANHCIRDQYEIIEHDKINADGTVTKIKTRVARPGMVSQLFFKGATEIQKNQYIYKIQLSDANLDLALLQVVAKLPYDKGSAIACNDAERGDTVFAVGNSFALLYSTLTKGIVSSITRSYRDLSLVNSEDSIDDGEHGFTQHSAVIAPGNSGGALYNDKMELVGVNVRAANSLGGFGFAVPLSDIKVFLKREKLDNLWDRCHG